MTVRKRPAKKRPEAAPELDTLDQQILTHLAADARAPWRELASGAGSNSSQIQRRVTRLESLGIIQGYKAEIADAALGYPVSAFMTIGLRSQHADAIDEFRAWADRTDEVVDYWMLSGEADFLLRLVARDAAHLGELILERVSRLEFVHTVRSSLILTRGKAGTLPPLMAAR